MPLLDILHDRGVEETQVAPDLQSVAQTVPWDLHPYRFFDLNDLYAVKTVDWVEEMQFAAAVRAKPFARVAPVPERNESNGIVLEIERCAPVAKVYSFSGGVCKNMLTGEDKALLVCGECGEAGDASPWFRPFFVADCDTPICLDCASSLLDMSRQD